MGDDEFLQLLSNALAQALSEREQRIFRLRFGLSGTAMTLAEVGECEGVSRERIRQLLNKSFRKLQYRSSAKFQADRPSAGHELRNFLYTCLKPGEDGFACRAAEFVDESLAFIPTYTHALPLLGGLLGSRDVPKDWLEEAGTHLKQRREAERLTLRDDGFRDRIATLFSFIHWQGAEVLTKDDAALIRPEGSARGNGYFSQKLGRDVQFGSGDEHRFFQRLERHPDVSFYQEHPFVIAYDFEGSKRTYRPDVFFILSGKGVVAEIQSVSAMGFYQNLCKWSAMKAFCKEQGLGLLVTDGTRAIQQVQRTVVPPEFEAALLARLHRGPLAWPDLKGLRDAHNAKLQDVVAVVLRNKLEWRLDPLDLRLKRTL